jgi:hypothetical protein
MTYIIKELRDNVDLDIKNPSFGTFDVLVHLDDNTKWLSIPYELYFEWSSKNNEKLMNYINQPKFTNFHQVIRDLKDLEYDFEKYLLQYIEKFFSPQIFKNLPSYNPDSIFGEEEDLYEF